MNPLQIVASVVGLALVAGVGVYVWNCEKIRAEYEAFVVKTELLGKEAERKAKEQEADDKRRKDKADDTILKLRADNIDLKRLQKSRSDRGYLPKPAPDSASPGRACFGYAELERTLQHLDAGVSSLIAEGADAIASLNVAKQWALDTPTPR